MANDEKTRIWIRVPEGPEGKSVLTTALERGFNTFLTTPASADALTGLGRYYLLVQDGDALTEDGDAVGVRAPIRSAEDQDKALALAGKHQVVLASPEDWKVIPYENLIAAYQNSSTKLAAEAAGPEDVRLLLETMEVGVDFVVVNAATPADVVALAEHVGRDGEGQVDLARATVTRVEPVGSGDRVCVDTASLLRPGEGLLVGSASRGLFLVHAETLESGYVAARPFRVNAGSVHAYVLRPGNRTKYLSEVQAGDEVLAVDAQGNVRSVVVGRVKIEQRPLLLVEVEVDGARVTTLLQNAETIRLVTPGGGAVSVVDVKPGDEVLVRVEDTGRHFGTPIRETITER